MTFSVNTFYWRILKFKCRRIYEFKNHSRAVSANDIVLALNFRFLVKANISGRKRNNFNIETIWVLLLLMGFYNSRFNCGFKCVYINFSLRELVAWMWSAENYVVYKTVWTTPKTWRSWGPNLWSINTSSSGNDIILNYFLISPFKNLYNNSCAVRNIIVQKYITTLNYWKCW